jgi:hypothetical protein
MAVRKKELATSPGKHQGSISCFPGIKVLYRDPKTIRYFLENNTRPSYPDKGFQLQKVG